MSLQLPEEASSVQPRSEARALRWHLPDCAEGMASEITSVQGTTWGASVLKVQEGPSEECRLLLNWYSEPHSGVLDFRYSSVSYSLADRQALADETGSILAPSSSSHFQACRDIAYST